MSDGNTIKLTMAGSKLSYDDDITIAQAAQIISYLDSDVALTTAASPIAAVSEVGGSLASERRPSGLTPRDALASAGAKTNPEKVVAFALYVEQQGDKNTFTLEDIKPLFRHAREPTPANLSRDLDTAIRSNWVAPASEKGEYYVTETAIDVLNSGFDSIRPGRGGGGKTKPASSRRSRKTSIPTPEAFTNIEISPTVDGYINYHKVKTTTDQYLWAINAAKLWGVEALTTGDIAWLTDKLGAGISPRVQSSYYSRHYKKGHVNKNTAGKVRVTPTGTEYIASLGAGTSE